MTLWKTFVLQRPQVRCPRQTAPGAQVIATAPVLPAEHCGYGTTHRSAAMGAVARRRGE